MHNSKFWTLNNDGIKVMRDLKKENVDKKFDVYGYWQKERGLDDINYMYFEIYELFDEYDSNGSDYERYGCKIDEGDVVVDIGGNIGMFSRRAIERGASKVVTFEPVATAFSCLVENVGNSVECHKIAISDKTGSTNFVTPDVVSNLGGSVRADKAEDNRDTAHTEKCITMSLTDLWDIGVLPERVNFLKIDCEGGEKEIIETITDEQLGRIDKISMEYHGSLLGHDLRESFTSRVRNMGFETFTLFQGGGDLVQLHIWRK